MEDKEKLFMQRMVEDFGYDLIGYKKDGTAELIKKEEVIPALWKTKH